MRILVVEDDILQLNGLTSVLNEVYDDIDCFTATDYPSAVEIIDNHSIQLFLLDIQLNVCSSEKNGIDIGKYIRSIPEYATTPILYLTALQGEAIKALHETNCFDYIVKPYAMSDLISSIDKLIKRRYIKHTPLEFRDNSGIYARVAPEDIIYIESHRYGMIIHIENRTYTTKFYTMNEILTKLPANFTQCQKSYIVNTSMVESYDKTNLSIKIKGNNSLIPLGRKYKDEFEKIMKG